MHDENFYIVMIVMSGFLENYVKLLSIVVAKFCLSCNEINFVWSKSYSRHSLSLGRVAVYVLDDEIQVSQFSRTGGILCLLFRRGFHDTKNAAPFHIYPAARPRKLVKRT
ncbi:hypothetical protein PGB90_003654 [Kerria lacca]